MLNIRITGITESASGFGLKLADNGHSIAYGPEDIQWEVLGGSRVRNIEGITWKQISGSTNVFPAGYPKARNAQKKVWFAKADNVVYECVYVYTITWIKDDDGSRHDFDPIISIKPSISSLEKLIPVLLTAVVTAILSLFTLKFLQKNKSDR